MNTFTPHDPHIADLPAILADRGVELGYRLTVAAPLGAVDDDLKRLLKKFRPLLVEALAQAELVGRSYAEVLTWDDDGFDWTTGEQVLPNDGDDPEPSEAEPW